MNAFSYDLVLRSGALFSKIVGEIQWVYRVLYCDPEAIEVDACWYGNQRSVAVMQVGAIRENYVKILASGFIHLRVLFKRLEYLSAAAADTWLRNKFFAEEIAKHTDLNLDAYDRKVFRQRLRIERFLDALNDEYRLLSEQTLPPKDRLSLLNRTVEDLDQVLKRDRYFSGEEEELSFE